MKYSVVLLAALLCNYVSSSTTADTERIIGGVRALLTQHPYTASLRHDGQHICGATIVAPQFLISAASCAVADSSPAAYTVLVGSASIDGTDEHAVISRVKFFVKHEQYNEKTKGNDIAVLVLSDPLDLKTKFVRAAPLPRQYESLPYGKPGIVTGWGLTKEEDPRSRAYNLKAVSLPILTDEICKRVYGPLVRSPPFQFCAGYLRGGRGICDGDIGGSFVHDGQLIGVVSFSKGCGRRSIPAVFTNISAYLKWIQFQIRKYTTEN